MHRKEDHRLELPSSLPAGFTELCKQLSRSAALGMVSSYLMHDIRNKLAVISGYTQILLLKGEQFKWGDISGRLELIMESVEKILSTLDNIGSFAQREKGLKCEIEPDKSFAFILASQQRKLESAGIKINNNTTASNRTLLVDASLFDYMLIKMLETFIPDEYGECELNLSSADVENSWQLHIRLTETDDDGKQCSGFLNRARDLSLVAALLAVESMQGELVLDEGPDDYGFTLTIPYGE